MGEELIIDQIKVSVNKRTLSVVIFRNSDNPLRSIQQYETAKAAWDELRSLYAAKTMINRIGGMGTLLSTKIKQK